MKDTVIGSRNLFFETESDTQLFGGSNTLFSESGSNLFNSDSSENTKTIPIKSQGE